MSVFSVHGHIANVHDDLCGNPGAFSSLMDAIDKASRTHCKIYTNTVINARNLIHLNDVAEGVKFSVSMGKILL